MTATCQQCASLVRELLDALLADDYPAARQAIEAILALVDAAEWGESPEPPSATEAFDALRETVGRYHDI